MTASRLSRAGKRVAVLERGREVLTGEFPGEFPDLKNELQRARQAACGRARRRALYDVRVGEDMHVLVACGLGGGSLVNAGVALRPDARVFADEVWPGQIAQDGLLDEGYRARAKRGCGRRAIRAHAEMTKYKALDSAGQRARDIDGRAADRRQFRWRRQCRGHRRSRPAR